MAAMKHIVITGASRGIGAELAQLLSTHHKVLLLSRNTASLQKIQLAAPNVLIETFDLSEQEQLTSLADTIKTKLGHVDILINNAGHLVNKPLTSISRDEILRQFEVNVFGLMGVCQQVIPFMKAGSHIVNIGSMGGFQGSVKFAGLSVYSASKAAVAGFSECLAEELKEQNIAVNCLALGAAQTEMLHEAFPGYQAPVSAHDMAQFISDFALNGNRWFNGKVLPVSLSTP